MKFRVWEKTPTPMSNNALYRMNAKAYIATFMAAGLCLAFIGYIFYNDWIVASLFALFGFLFPKAWAKKAVEQRKLELRMQFKQALQALSSSLGAGKSIENAFREAEGDLYMLYGERESLLLQEWRRINARMANGEPLDIGLRDFSMRADVEEITNFKDVLLTAKRTGGDLAEIVRRASTILGDKLDTQQEISVMIAQKKFEAKIMSLMPFGIVAFLRFTSGGYMDPLFGNARGILLMSAELAGFLIAFWWTQKLMRVRV